MGQRCAAPCTALAADPQSTEITKNPFSYLGMHIARAQLSTTLALSCSCHVCTHFKAHLPSHTGHIPHDQDPGGIN